MWEFADDLREAYEELRAAAGVMRADATSAAERPLAGAKTNGRRGRASRVAVPTG